MLGYNLVVMWESEWKQRALQPQRLPFFCCKLGCRRTAQFVLPPLSKFPPLAHRISLLMLPPPIIEMATTYPSFRPVNVPQHFIQTVLLVQHRHDAT